MSMVICEHCDRPVDSDEDPECFVEVGNQTTIICEFCRWDDEDEHGQWREETETQQELT